MGFVYKEMSQADADALWDKLRGTVVQFQTSSVIDEVNDIHFIDLGAESSNRGVKDVNYYNLLWHGYAIAIEGDVDYVREASGFSILFNLSRISIPREAGVDVEAVRQILAEAIAVYIGALQDRTYAAKVSLPSVIEWV